ncbi:MAG: isoamylase early set domain-containing protein [Thermodesulfobacteriota bacterium]
MATRSEKKPKSTEKVRKTEFSLSASQAQSVSTVGDFNRWNPSSHPMKMDDEGIWRISLALNPGQYEYGFFVDGECQNDPNCFSSAENPFGTSNSLKIVK